MVIQTLLSNLFHKQIQYFRNAFFTKGIEIRKSLYYTFITNSLKVEIMKERIKLDDILWAYTNDGRFS